MATVPNNPSIGLRAPTRSSSLVVAFAVTWCAVSTTVAQLPTTIEDFFHAGSQPDSGVVYDTFRPSSNCRSCHESNGPDTIPVFGAWQGSMMAQAARDPLFEACLTVANQDAAFVGDVCIRCHTPGGWLAGRSSPTDGSALIEVDRDGVSCSACHRMVDPDFKPGISPPIDESILANLLNAPVTPGNGNYVMDPVDDRRGPYPDPVFPGHTWIHSPFHQTSELCATCHDVSNPAYQRQPDGSFVLNLLDTAHATSEPGDMFPLERTYSEWKHSSFADGGVDMGGRFGGTQAVVSTCQDCHMPKTTSVGALGSIERDDLAIHELSGGSTWTQLMVLNLFPTSGIEEENILNGIASAASMLRRACRVELSQVGNHTHVRIVNETGHKLPTGYPEGRRMWIQTTALDDELAVLRQYGAYDDATAELSTADTKVYEAVLGVDAAVARVTGIPEGPSFHFAVNNVVLKDNRIPPRGFTNAEYASVQADPVRATYADGQHWDDTRFRLPVGAATVNVRVFYQSASKDYVTFLRDENTTNDAGDILYEQWELTGKSPPVMMSETTLVIAPFPRGDADASGLTDLDDYRLFAVCQSDPEGEPIEPECREFDFDVDDDLDLRDYAEFQIAIEG